MTIYDPTKVVITGVCYNAPEVNQSLLNVNSVRFRRGRKFVVLVVGGRAAS